jgi:dTDP-glucose 4,6-dehydratase/UDP-glucose 4-epimerase
MRKRVLVTGSSGFIGTALAKELMKRGYLVDGCDILSNELTRQFNNFYFAGNSENLFENIFRNQYELCINCAGSASVPFSFEDPFKDYELNTRVVFSILSGIKNHFPECKFINLSSAAIYGNPQQLPVEESFSPAPISPYGIHKHMSEMICDEFSRFFGIRTCSLRIFSAYGPGLKKQLFWDLYQKAVKGDLRLFGTGNESRDFIYIDDLVNAILLVAQSDFKHRAINIANGEQQYIKDIVAQFVKQFDPSLSFSFTGDVKQGDPVNWEADISILRSLGYGPRFSMEQGIAHYADWLKQ